MAGFSAAGLTKGQSGVLKPPKPPTLTKGQSGVGIITTQPRVTPGSLGLTKGISGTGIITTQPRPPGATPSTLGQAPQPPQPSAGGAAATGGDPGAQLDASALANIAANQFKVNNQINALNLQGSDAGTSLQSTLAQLAYQQPRQSLALEQKFNQGGGLYSSPEAQGEGDLNHAFLVRQTGAQTKYGQTMSGIAAKIAALQGGLPLFSDQQAAGSAGRESQIAANSAPPPPPGVPQAPAATRRASQPGGTVVRPNGNGIIRDVTRATPKLQSLASQIAGRKTVTLKPVQGKGRLRG